MPEIRLRIYHSPSEFSAETFRQARVTVGREINNDIVVAEKEVSRIHCAFESDEKGWRVVDLESTNGTYVNGIRIKQTALRNGDVVVVGSTRLHVLECPSDVSPAPPSLGGYRIVRTFDARGSLESKEQPSGARPTAAVKDLRREDTAPESRSLMIPASLVFSADEIRRGANDPRALAKTIAARLMRGVATDVCLVYLCQPGTQTLDCMAVEPPSETPTVAAGILDYVREQKMAVHVEIDESAGPQPAHARAVMCAPMLDGEQLLGAIALLRREARWKEDDPNLEKLAVGALLAATISSCARSYGRLEEAYLELLDAADPLPVSIGDLQQDKAALILLDATIQEMRGTLSRIREKGAILAEETKPTPSWEPLVAELAEMASQSDHLADRLACLVHQGREAQGESCPAALLADLLPLLRQVVGTTIEITDRVAAELPAVAVAPRVLRAAITRIVLFCRDRMHSTRLTLAAELCESEKPIVVEGYDEIAPGRHVHVSIEAEGDMTAMEELRVLRDSETSGVRDLRSPVAGLYWAARILRRSTARLIVRPQAERLIVFDLYLPVLM